MEEKGECSWENEDFFQLTNFRTRYLKEFFRDKIFYLHLSTSGSRRKALRDCLLPSKNTIMLVKRQSFLIKKHAHGIIECFVIRIDDHFVISASFLHYLACILCAIIHATNVLRVKEHGACNHLSQIARGLQVSIK